MRKSILTVSVAAALSVPLAASAEGNTLTGNFGFFSQYIFRGLTQTDRNPALQGGFDYSHSSGLYLGTWASNISWLSDYGAYNGSSMEWDFYGGYKNSVGPFGYDVGLLQYYYPGSVNPGLNKADTTELYGALSWKWLSAKLSYSVGDKIFGVADSQGTYYLDLTASYPVSDKLSVVAHYGIQKYKGQDPASSVSNDDAASYKDWKLGLSYALPKDFTIGAYYTGTDMTETQKTFYTPSATGRELGKGTGTIYVQKVF